MKQSQILNKIETERLIMLPTSADDGQLIYEMMTAPKFIQFVGDRGLTSEEDGANYVEEKMLPHFEKNGFGSYTMILKSNNEKIGTCGLYNREGVEGVDIGFGLLPQFEGNGYAFEAANKMMQVAREKLQITKVEGITDKQNLASQKLLEKIGLLKVGTTILPGETEELFLYSTEK